MLSPAKIEGFECSKCGACCRWGGSVLLTDGDISRLAAHLELSEEEFIARHTRLAPSRKQLALMDQLDGSCFFLEGDSCSVYEVRPEQCRTFPFAWHVEEGCPVLDRLSATNEKH